MSVVEPLVWAIEQLIEKVNETNNLLRDQNDLLQEAIYGEEKTDGNLN